MNQLSNNHRPDQPSRPVRRRIALSALAALAGVAGVQLFGSSASADPARDDRPTVTVVRCWPECFIEYPPMPPVTTRPPAKPKPKPTAMTEVGVIPVAADALSPAR
jgi:hypothetical protein